MSLMLIGAALLVTAPAPLQAAPAPTSVVTAPSVAAMAIAEQLASDTVVLAQTRRMLRTQLPTVLAANPDMLTLEQQLPGITAEFIDVMEPIIIASLSRQMPAYRRDVAAVFDRRMTPAEVDAAHTFYLSPVGERLVERMRDGLDFTALLDRQIRAGGEAKISGEDIGAAVKPAVQPAINTLSADDQLRLVSFAMTSAGRKMAAINPELLELSARFNNQTDPAVDKQIETAVTALIARRTASERKK